MVHVESGLKSEQVLLLKPIYNEKRILVYKQVVLIARVVLISRGLYSEILLYMFKYPLIFVCLVPS